MLEKFSFFEKVKLLTSCVLFSKNSNFILNVYAFFGIIILSLFSHWEEVKNMSFPINGKERSLDEVLEAIYLSKLAEELSEKGLLQVFCQSFLEKGESNNEE
jgi:hypothetical protein